VRYASKRRSPVTSLGVLVDNRGVEKPPDRGDGAAFDRALTLEDSEAPPLVGAERGAGQARPEVGRWRPSRPFLQRCLEGEGGSSLRFAVDAVLLSVAVGAAFLGAPAAGVSTYGVTPVWLFPPLVLALLALRGAYRATLEVRILDSIGQVVGATSLTAMTLIAVDTLVIADMPGVGLTVRAWLFGTLYVAGGRAFLGATQRRARTHRLVGSGTLIVGAGRIGALVERRLRTHPELGLVTLGYLDADPAPAELAPARRAPVLGPPSDLSRIARETGARHVILAFLSAPDHVLVPLVRQCEEQGLELSVVPRLFDSVNARVELEHIGGLPLYGLRALDPRGWQFAVKNILGQAIAVILVLVLAPVIAAVALAVKLTSPGPILFRQRRIGRDGHDFELLKFRSIRISQDPGGCPPAAWGSEGGDAGATSDATSTDVDSTLERVGPGGLEGDLRLTPIGRFIRRSSLDELPQLWNVLRGDMALVGPRPERPEFVELFGQSIRRYDDRHRVKSGVTGWAQVNGLRGRTSLGDRVEWDNYYIENWSLWLDLKILLMTLSVPFRRTE